MTVMPRPYCPKCKTETDRSQKTDRFGVTYHWCAVCGQMVIPQWHKPNSLK